MDKFTPTPIERSIVPQEIVFLQTGEIDLATARILISGQTHWLLIGDGWQQMAEHSWAIPEIDHPVVIFVDPYFTDEKLFQLYVSPNQFSGIRIARSEVEK